MILACTLAALLVVSWFAVDWPSTEAREYPGGLTVRDNSGNVLRVTLGKGDVDCRPTYRVSTDDWIVKAIVAIEDDEFWTHRGVRPLSVVRAFGQNLRFGRRVSGASTLTMQTVRLLRPHPKTLLWKFKEAVMALKMERVRDKEWILAQYLNRAPFGSNLVGIEAAANGWFGKGAKELGLGEAALLAGMVQAPSRFRPDRGYARALVRRELVLDRMRALGMISDEQLAGAKSVRPRICRAPRPFKAPHFCDWVLKRCGQDPSLLPNGGVLDTALDADLQRMAEETVSASAAKGGYSTAAIILRAKTGDVLAMACSGNYRDPDGGQVNTADCLRSAGSTLKPFLTAFALDRGTVTPEERLGDFQRKYHGYRPANFDGRYRGLVTVRDALVQSLNLPFVDLLSRTGVEEFGACLRELGFAHLGASDQEYGLGMAIGNVEVTLMELVLAYACLTRNGRACGSNVQIFSSESAYLVSDMLSGSERSSCAIGHVADVDLPRFAWKTGTSSAYRDAWTVAWNPEYVIGVWCGHKRGGFGDRSVIGATAAAPVAWSLARGLYPRNTARWFAKPSGVVREKVCSLTGKTATELCPHVEDGFALLGRRPETLCSEHIRGLDGKVVARRTALRDPHARLEIASPDADSVLTLVRGVRQQKVVCRTNGNRQGERLWWFMNGVPCGESAGSEPLVLDMAVGRHELVCTTATGRSAETRFEVREEP